jgi:predicted enzyme related to lactoylglutathione lyase
MPPTTVADDRRRRPRPGMGEGAIMSIQLGNITLDCDDVARVSAFWSAALERPVDDGASPYFAMISGADGGGPNWFFLKVPEPKTAKNRMHVDFGASDRPGEVARLVALGATKIADKAEGGHEWTILADPEGNEFCVAATS